jgi:hypothetical protein
MKNKLILLTLLLTSNLFGESEPIQRTILSYKNIPQHLYENPVELQFSLLFSAWSAKYTVYNCDEIQCAHLTFFSVYNDDCCFTLQLNKTTHDCTVEFTVNDKSFDYNNFKSIMDCFLLYA